MTALFNKQSILILCPIYKPYAGGGGQYFPLLVKNIASLNLFKRVIVLTEYHKYHSIVENESGIILIRCLPKRDSLEDKSLLYSVISFLVTYLMILFLVPVLIILFKVSIFQFTRYYYLPLFFLSWFIQNILGAKVILDIRTNVERDYIFKKMFGVNIYLSISKNITEQLIRAGKRSDQITEIPNVIEFDKKNSLASDLDIIKMHLSKDQKKYILFVGQLVDRKSIKEALDAFKDYRADNPLSYFVIIGRDMYNLESKGLLKKTDGIIYLGEQPREVALAFIRQSSLILQPSKMEGISRVSLEALKYNKMVLLPNCVDEFVSSNPSFTVKHNTAREILSKIYELLESKDKPIYDVSIHHPEYHKQRLLELYKSLFNG